MVESLTRQQDSYVRESGLARMDVEEALAKASRLLERIEIRFAFARAGEHILMWLHERIQEKGSEVRKVYPLTFLLTVDGLIPPHRRHLIMLSLVCDQEIGSPPPVP